MKYERTEWWVEYNFENGIPMNIKVFSNKKEAEAFADWIIRHEDVIKEDKK